MSATDDPVAALPFVGDRPPVRPQPRRCFWLVRSTGDFDQDQRLGEEYGLAFLRWEVAQDHNVHYWVLPKIIADMPRELTSIEIAILTIVGIAACAGVDDADRVAARWRSRREARR
jgi:hypothetical protein